MTALKQKLIQETHRLELAEKFNRAERGEGEWIKLKDIK